MNSMNDMIRYSMKYIRYLPNLVGSLIAAYIVACAPVKFEKKVECGAGCVKVEPNGLINYDVTISVGGAKVDILIMNDNSASMSPEQRAMAARFANFISALDSKSVDYRIAVITSDVSATSGNGPRPINGNGALQNGNLITFNNGEKFLTPLTTNKLALFAAAMERQETLKCENYLISTPGAPNYAANCPSADERGIYAANLVIQNNPSGFIRSDAGLAIVFLSDEDARSSVYTSYISYSLESMDMPQTLISNIQSRFTGKSYTFHSIIIKPGALINGVSAKDAANRIFSSFRAGGNQSSSGAPTTLFAPSDAAAAACLTAQSSQINSVRGSYGYLYALATRITGGFEGSICEADYGAQLSIIGNQIGQKINSISLNCADTKDLTVTFVSGPAVAWSQVGNTINFSSNLAVGSKVRAQYKCQPSI